MSPIPLHKLIAIVIARVTGFFLILALMLFLPAGNWGYWQAWMYLGTMTAMMLVTLVYLAKNDPALLERRMRMREKERPQQRVVAVSGIFLFLSFLIPGLDIRYGWSGMPAWGAILANLVVIIGYLLVIWVFRTNSYTSRIVEVEAGQTVVSSGPYALVRHPMYVGAFFCYAFSPLALGSYWAFLPGLMILPVLVVRLINEEAVLLRELPGYREYTQKVKYRLLPGVW